MFDLSLKAIRENTPLIHCITNYVSINDCANILLATGASPIMAEAISDVMEITPRAKSLYINLGMLSDVKFEAMDLACKIATENNVPIVLDPVGAGASSYRREAALRLLDKYRITVIRGNSSEIKALSGKLGTAEGVDSFEILSRRKDPSEIAKTLASKRSVIVAMTGSTDTVTDGNSTYLIRNGHPMMRSVTGSGCQLSALVAAYLAVNVITPLDAVAAAVCAMGLAGQIAFNRLTEIDGNASYRNYIIDAIYNLTPETLKEGAKYEIK